MRFSSIAVFVAISPGGRLLIGSVSAPGEWYKSLAKPAVNPSPYVFGAVWSLPCVFIGTAGARVWERGRQSAHVLWLAQMGLNFA